MRSAQQVAKRLSAITVRSVMGLQGPRVGWRLVVRPKRSEGLQEGASRHSRRRGLATPPSARKGVKKSEIL